MMPLTPDAPPLTVARAARLQRFLRLVAGHPLSRTDLMAGLGLDRRGFFRDLEYLRAAGADVAEVGGRYRLNGRLSDARSRILTPNPGLTFGEAVRLARGERGARRKLLDFIAAVAGRKKHTEGKA